VAKNPLELRAKTVKKIKTSKIQRNFLSPPNKHFFPLNFTFFPRNYRTTYFSSKKSAGLHSNFVKFTVNSSAGRLGSLGKSLRDHPLE